MRFEVEEHYTFRRNLWINALEERLFVTVVSYFDSTYHLETQTGFSFASKTERCSLIEVKGGLWPQQLVYRPYQDVYVVCRISNANSDHICQYIKYQTTYTFRNGDQYRSWTLIKFHRQKACKPIHFIGSTNRNHIEESQMDLSTKIMERNVNWILDTPSD